MGVYLEKASCDNLPMDWLKEVLSESGGPAEVERFCDSTGEYQRKYNVHKISAGEKAYVLKYSDKMETALYRDFLQFNGILHEGRVYMIDWGFGGIMPYALDIARLIVHGSEMQEDGGFPFYMDDELRKIFVHTQYEKLRQKPDWDRYIMDIRLAALNEYVEFLEEDLNDPEVSREEIEGGFYYKRARELAEIISSHLSGFAK